MTDYDHTEVYRRHIDGARLIFESPEEPGSAPLHPGCLRPGRKADDHGDDEDLADMRTLALALAFGGV